MGQVDTIQINTLDKKLVQDRFGKNMTSYNQAASVQKEICVQLSEELKSQFTGNIHKVLELGCGTGLLTQQLANWMNPATYFANDLVPFAEDWVQPIFNTNPTNFKFLAGDGEQIPYPEKLDAVVTTSAIQWFQNFHDFSIKVHKALTANGILAFATFGPENFKEVREINGTGLEYLNLEEHLDALRADYNIEFQKESENQMFFRYPIEVLKHIKNIGVNGISSEKWTPKKLQMFLENYSDRFTNNEGKVVLTYHPILIIARKK